MMATGDPVGPPSVVQQNALFAYKVEVQPVIYFHSTHGVAGKVFGFISIFPVLTLNLTDYGEKYFLLSLRDYICTLAFPSLQCCPNNVNCHCLVVFRQDIFDQRHIVGGCDIVKLVLLVETIVVPTLVTGPNDRAIEPNGKK